MAPLSFLRQSFLFCTIGVNEVAINQIGGVLGISGMIIVFDARARERAADFDAWSDVD